MGAYCLRHLKAAFVLAVGFKEDHHYTLLHFGTVLFFFFSWRIPPWVSFFMRLVTRAIAKATASAMWASFALAFFFL